MTVRFRHKYHSILFVLILAICLLPVISSAAIELTAEVDNLSPTVGSRISYSITISGGTSLPDIELPDLNNFEIVMGPSSSTSIQMINGRVSRSKTLTYILRPLKSGHLSLGPIKVKHRRKTYVSNTIELDVRPSGAPPPTVSTTPSTNNKNEALPAGKAELPDLFFTATADKDTVYRQEMVVVTYKLYLRANVTGYEFGKLPQARGFWQEEFDIGTRPVTRDVTIRGQSYKMAVMRKIGLFPTRTGKLELEPLVIDCQVELPRSRTRRSRDTMDRFFDDSFFSRRNREMRSVSTERLTLSVLDLPAQGKPLSFKGDVGDMNLRVSYDKNQLSQHDALTINVTISGTGYLKSVDAPKLTLPSGFEQFNPTVTEKIRLSGGVMKGSKKFSYLLIPRRSGTFNLNPVKFSYFNPETERYKTLKSRMTRIIVNPAESGLASGGWIERSDVALLDSDIRFIKELNSPLTATIRPIYNSIWFYIALSIAPFLFLLGLGTEVIIISQMSDPAALRRRRAPEKMRRNLKEAGKNARRGNFGQAIEMAGKGLSELAAAIAGIPTAGIISELMSKKLAEHGADVELTTEVLNLIQEADRIRFSGATLNNDSTTTILDRISKAVSMLEKLR
ncbi:protein BatD [bacterium]|nr:protein BatD [bacterium]